MNHSGFRDLQANNLVDSVIPVTTMIFSVLGLVINSIFIYLTIKGIRDKVLPLKVPSTLRPQLDTKELNTGGKTEALFGQIHFPFKLHAICQTAYSLLLNRSFTDVLTSVLTLIFVSLHRYDQIPDPKLYPDKYQNMTLEELDYLIPHGRTMFTMLLTLNFWASAGCYSVLALFMFLAVRHPIIYRVKITSKRTSKYTLPTYLL
ncbi:hypothetical protein COOONC_12515 [Cooperia oncophora]